MVQNTLPQKSPDLTPTPLKKSLRLKMTGLLIFLVCIPALLVILLPDYSNIPMLIVFTSVIVSTAGIFLLWLLLKPLDDLYKSAHILAKGELKHRINLKSGDEIQFIATSLNQMAQNLDLTLQTLEYDKYLVSLERNKLNLIISSIVDGIMVLDIHRKVILVNKSAEKMTGFSATEMLGNPFDQLVSIKNLDGGIVPAKKLSFDSYHEQSSPPSKFPTLVHLMGKNGHQTKAEITFVQVNGQIATDLGLILIMHDITQEKLFEQMQIDFVSMASHEFRTPLTSVISYLSILQEEIKNKLNDDQKMFLERALTSAQHLGELVTNLLNVSKIERGSFILATSAIDWQQRLNQLVENNRPLAIQKNITLKTNLPPQPIPKIMADTVRINEVVNNLITNAINYTPEGGQIEVGTRLEGAEVLTYVADTGMGIPEDALPHLFGKFFRVPGSLEHASKGSGLGLYITKSIVDLHHGKIWVNSTLGKGSTFYFTLPTVDLTKANPTIVDLKPKG